MQHLIVTALLFCAPVSGEAQQISLKPYDEVRIQRTRGDTVQGTLLYIVHDSIRIIGRNRMVIPWADAASISVKRGRVLKGMGIGALIGTGAGLFTTFAFPQHCTYVCGPPVGIIMPPAGALLGAIFHPSDWRVVK